MPQIVELPPIGQDQRGALLALVRVCKEIPAKGEPFRELRTRLRMAKLWDRERPAVLLRFLGVGGATVTPSPVVQALAAANTEDEIAFATLDRVWQLNPLLAKTVIDLVAQRPYHKDEIYKHLASAAYRGVVPSRPALEVWLQIAIGTGLLRTIGISVASGPRIERYAQHAGTFDADEFLAEDRPEPEPVIPTAVDDDGGVAATSAAPADATVAEGTPVGAALPAPLRHLSADGIPSPRGRERLIEPRRPSAALLAGSESRLAIVPSRFAHGFSDDLLGETTARIAAWWADAARAGDSYQPSDFGLDPEAWVERADEVVYRAAVAAALAFRLDRDRGGVVAAFAALDRAGILGDLFQGIVPENLPGHVDARALMLASLAARRCSEVPELATQLEGLASAGDAFAALDAALGRGLFRTELFWILDMLAKLGVLRYPDLADYTVTPHRIVRDTLFRLGFLHSPYASDAPSLAAAARAARKAVPDGPADEILTLFALAAGCAYDCRHRKACDFPCRERLE